MRVREDAPKAFDRFKGDVLEYDVVEISHSTATIEHSITGDYGYALTIPTKYLVKVDAEAKEAKFKVGQFAMFKGRRVEIIGYSEHYPQMYRVFVLTENYHTDAKESDLEPYAEPTEQTEAEKPNHTIKIPVEVDLTESFWDAYAADLAKEIALKVANKYSDPKEVAEYAVKVAKAVVEGLKGK